MSCLVSNRAVLVSASTTRALIGGAGLSRAALLGRRKQEERMARETEARREGDRRSNMAATW